MSTYPEYLRALSNIAAYSPRTARGRLYKALMVLQVQLQVEGDEEAEAVLCELMDGLCREGQPK